MIPGKKERNTPGLIKLSRGIKSTLILPPSQKYQQVTQ